MELIILAAAAFFIYTFINYIRRGNEPVTCPNCEEQQVRVVDQQLKKLSQNDHSDLLGMRLDVKLIMKTQYRCKVCDHGWQVTAPEK